VPSRRCGRGDSNLSRALPATSSPVVARADRGGDECLH
jgi:hypothetical protein